MSFKKLSVQLFALVALFLLAGCPGGPPPASVVIGEQAPEFTLLNMEGENVSLSDFRGQVVVLNFWATWCLSLIHISEPTRPY